MVHLSYTVQLASGTPPTATAIFEVITEYGTPSLNSASLLTGRFLYTRLACNGLHMNPGFD